MLAMIHDQVALSINMCKNMSEGKESQRFKQSRKSQDHAGAVTRFIEHQVNYNVARQSGEMTYSADIER